MARTVNPSQPAVWRRTCCDIGVGGSSQPLARFFLRLSFFFWFFVSAPLPVACRS